MTWANSKDGQTLIGRGLSSMRRIIDYVDVALGESKLVSVSTWNVEVEKLEAEGWVLWSVTTKHMLFKRKKTRKS